MMAAPSAPEFDAVVIGSGMTGGLAAKELCERGFKVLLVERGRPVDHGGDEYTDHLAPWERRLGGRPPEPFLNANPDIKSFQTNPDNLDWFVTDEQQTYEQAKPFSWIRSYNLGGRSLLWARRSFRMSETDLRSNAADGHGVPWPLGYDDLKPWYDRVERFMGVSGNEDGIETLPDGVFQPPFDWTAAEKTVRDRIENAYPTRRVIMARTANLTQPTDEQTGLGRARCQARNYCKKGCSLGAYYSTQSGSLPAARATGNLTVMTDAVVGGLDTDPSGARVVAAKVIDAKTGERLRVTARAFFLNASTVGSTQILMMSATERAPGGLGNQGGALGSYLNDHVGGVYASGYLDEHLDRYHRGRRPTGFYIPRYANFTEEAAAFPRGFGWQGVGLREDWRRGAEGPGFGERTKHAMRAPGAWRIQLFMYGEAIPRRENHMRLHPSKQDRWGMPLVVFDAAFGGEEARMKDAAERDGAAMLEAAGCRNVRVRRAEEPVGYKIHEFGTAVMGDDPARSVVNARNQVHGIANLFVTDGACMPSAASQNPSLTYMALTARAADYAAGRMALGDW